MKEDYLDIPQLRAKFTIKERCKNIICSLKLMSSRNRVKRICNKIEKYIQSRDLEYTKFVRGVGNVCSEFRIYSFNDDEITLLREKMKKYYYITHSLNYYAPNLARYFESGTIELKIYYKE